MTLTASAAGPAPVRPPDLGSSDIPQLPDSEPVFQLDRLRSNLDEYGRIDELQEGHPTIVLVTQICNNGGPAWAPIV